MTAHDLDRITEVLGARREEFGDQVVLSIGSAGTQTVALSLHGSAEVFTVVSAQTSYGYFEIHEVIRHVVVEPDEVIFLAESGEHLSGMVIGRSGACSLFANVDRAILSSDLAQLDPALLLAAMQLGLAEASSI